MITNQIQGLVDAEISAVGGDACSRTAPESVTCSDLTLQKGDRRTFFVTVQTPEEAPPNSAFDSCASVANLAGVTDPDASENGPACTQVRIVERGADVRVTKFVEPSSFVRAGETFTFTTLVDNLGPTAALTVTLTDTVQAGGSFQVLTVSDSSNSLCTPPPVGPTHALTVGCVLSDALPAGSLWTLTIVATADEDMEIYSRALAFNQAPSDPDLDNNVDDTLIQVGDVADLDLRATAATTGTLNPGDAFAYTINIGNAGPSPAANVVVKSTLPLGLALVDLPPFCATLQTVAENVQITCTVGTLDVGKATEFDVLAQAKTNTQPGLFFVPVNVASDAYDINTRNNNTHVRAEVAESAETANLTIALATAHGTPAPGDLVNLQLTVTNHGPSAAAQVVAQALFPPGLLLLATDQSCAIESGCSLGTIDADETVSIQLTAHIQRDVTCNEPLPVSATVSTLTQSSSIGTMPSSQNALLNFAPVCAADLRVLQLEESQPDLLVGQRFTRTLIVDNLGPGDAHNVVLEAEMSAAAPFEIVTILPDAEGKRPSARCTLSPPGVGGTSILPLALQQANLLCHLDQALEPVQTSSPVQAASLAQTLAPDAAPDAGAGRWVVQLVMRAVRPLHIDSMVDVSSSDVDSNPENNLDTGQQPVACTEPASANGNVDLALDVLLTGAESMGDLPTVVTGSTVTFTLQTTNYTRQSAVCAQLVEVVPTRTRFNAAASTPGWNCADGAPAGTVCTYAIYVAPSGIMQTVDFAVTVDSFTTGGELTNNVVALEDDGQDRNRSNNDDTMKLLIVMPVRNWFPMIHR